MARILASDDDFLLLKVENEIRAIYVGSDLAVPPALVEMKGNLKKYMTCHRIEAGEQHNIHEVFPPGAPPEYNDFYDEMSTKGYCVWKYEEETIIGMSGRETMAQLRALPPTMVDHDMLKITRTVRDKVYEFACLNVIPCVQAFHQNKIVFGHIRPSIFYVSNNRDDEYNLRVICNYRDLNKVKTYYPNQWFLAPQQFLGLADFDMIAADLYSAAIVFLYWFSRIINPSSEVKAAAYKMQKYLRPMSLKQCYKYAEACASYVTDGHFDEQEWIKIRAEYKQECKKVFSI